MIITHSNTQAGIEIKDFKKAIAPLEEMIFLDGEKYFESLFLDVALAKTRIDLETYIFENDALGRRITEELIKASHRGVKIRILVDGAGAPNWGGPLTKKLEASGIETRVFHPLPWSLSQLRIAMVHLPFLFKIIYFLIRINKRNHRKTCIIDQNIVYIGSANITQCHLSTDRQGKNWRDTIVKLTNVNITHLEEAFEEAWTHKTTQDRIHNIFQHVNTREIIRLNNTRHRRRVLHKNLLRRVSRCKDRVWITNAYFIPDNFLLKQLQELAQLGVDVRILLPQKADVFIMPWASSTFYENLIKAGVRIFEYIPSMLHAKSLILDNWFLVGSSNLNHRSLLHDLEVDASIQMETSKQILEQQFLEDLSHANEIEFGQWQKKPLIQKLLGRLLLYIKYWI